MLIKQEVQDLEAVLLCAESEYLRAPTAGTMCALYLAQRALADAHEDAILPSEGL